VDAVDSSISIRPKHPEQLLSMKQKGRSPTLDSDLFAISVGMNFILTATIIYY